MSHDYNPDPGPDPNPNLNPEPGSNPEPEPEPEPNPDPNPDQAPMGASYCTEGNGTAGSEGGPGGDAYSCGAWTDQRTAAANHQALAQPWP